MRQQLGCRPLACVPGGSWAKKRLRLRAKKGDFARALELDIGAVTHDGHRASDARSDSRDRPTQKASDTHGSVDDA